MPAFPLFHMLLAALPAMASPAAAGEAAPDGVRPDHVRIVAGAVARPLSDRRGDPAAGRLSFADRKAGNCLACHANRDMPEHLFHGDVGPALDGVAERWSEGEMRAILVDAKQVFGDQTIMPGFYTLNVGADVRKDLIGETILSAGQVEDILAYLKTLK